MVSSAQQFFHEQFLFQDDNAPCHRTKLVTKWKSQKNFRTLNWPARSPDLNLIENMRHKVALEISKRHPTNKQELIELIITAWNCVVAHDHLVKLVHSIPKRCRQVLKSKGWPIKY